MLASLVDVLRLNNVKNRDQHDEKYRKNPDDEESDSMVGYI